MTPGNMFRFAREVALHCKNKELRDALRARTDDCKEDFDRFCISASHADMELLVASWSRLVLALDTVGPLPDGDPTSAGRLKLPTTGSFVHDPDIHEVLTKAA